MARRDDILSHFSGTPWDVQVPVLRALEAGWADHDVFVLRLPVASGKSKIADCLLRWAMSTGRTPSGVIVANNRLLVEQYLNTTTNYKTLLRGDTYECSLHGIPCTRRKQLTDRYCLENGNIHHPSSCAFVRDLRTARGRNRLVVNQHIYMAHKLYRELGVFDEAHTVERMIAEMSAVQLWRSEFKWPRQLVDAADVRRWLDSLPAGTEDSRLAELDAALSPGTGRPKWTVTTGSEELRGRDVEYIRLEPLDISDRAGVMWPPKVGKVVLMSATMSDSDVTALGLDGRRVLVVEAESPIDPARRAIIHRPVAPMDFARRDVGVNPVCRHILERILPAYEGMRGVIHAPYALHAALRRELGGVNRLVWADRSDRNRVVGEFASGGYAADSVLVGAGLSEGLDLRDDLARFQVVVSMPRKSVGDSGLLWLAENDPARYEWLTVREFAQTCGRVSRHPGDWGDTYVLDSTASRELSSPQLPKWAREAVILA